MRKAITVKFVGPTNTRGARYIARHYTGDGDRTGTLTHSADYALNVEGNAREAAHKLAAKFGWAGVWVGGQDYRGDYQFVWIGDGTNYGLFGTEAQPNAPYPGEPAFIIEQVTSP